MFNRYWIVVQVGLLIFGFIWCKEVIGRFRSDLTDLKETDDAGHKGVIVFFWLVTVIIMILMAIFAWYLVGNIIEAIRSFQ